MKLALVAAAAIVPLGCARKPVSSPAAPQGVPAGLTAQRPPPAIPPADPPGPSSPRHLSLRECMAKAWAASHAVLQAERRIAIAEQRRRAAARDQAPTLEVGGGVGYRTGRTQANFGDVEDASFWRFDPQVALVYRMNPGAMSKRSRATDLDRAATEYDLAETRRQAMIAVTRAYTDVALSQAAVDISDQLLEDAERFLAIAQARAEAEVAPEADMILAQAELANARRARRDAQGQWEATSATLAILLRSDPKALIATPPTEPVALVRLDDSAPLTEEAQGARPDRRAAAMRVNAARARRDAARFEIFVPDLFLEIRERFIGSGASNIGPGTIAQGFIGWTFSLGDFSRAKTAAQEQDLAALRENEIQERIGGEIAEALARARASRASIEAARDALAATERHHGIQLARFDAGSALGIEVIAAQNAVARARLQLHADVLRYNQAQLEVLAATGRLDPKSLDTARRADPLPARRDR